MSTSKDQLDEKISTLQNQTKSYAHEIRELLEKLPIHKNINVISYFTSTFNISYNEELESLCLGSYHIYNIGNEPLINPYICIKLPKDSFFSFSGRYAHDQSRASFKGPNEWIRTMNTTLKNEFWLKPIGKTTIGPNEIITFPNFQIRWPSNKSYEGSITGTTYCDQLEDGIAVVNPINISLINVIQEDDHESL